MSHITPFKPAHFPVKVKPQYGFEVGISVGGYLRIAQTIDPEGESLILLSPSEMHLLIDALSELSGGDWWSSTESEESGDE